MAWLKRSYKRDWIQRSPYLNTVSYKHELSNISTWEVKPEFLDNPKESLKWPESWYPVEIIRAVFEINFSIGSEMIRIHANENIGPGDALRDYVRKLEQLKDILGRFLRDYKTHFEMDKTFTLKEFLYNEDATHSLYTSSVAIGVSHYSGFFFEVSSCERKGRLYENKEKDFLEVINKLIKFFATAITDAKATLDTYKGKL